MGSIPGFFSLSDETLNRGPMTIVQDKLPTRTDCDEAEDYVVPNVLSPRDLVFRPDIGHKLYQHQSHVIVSSREDPVLDCSREGHALDCSRECNVLDCSRESHALDSSREGNLLY